MASFRSEFAAIRDAMLRLAWLAAAADDDLWNHAAERNAFPPESADRLYGWRADPGPRGAAEDAACFASAYWFQLRDWLRLELVDGRAQVVDCNNQSKCILLKAVG